jgi:Asp-tRNA(Asn)/Glu-tRNA(Gln) amidotransferase A subunit family amidase
MIRWGRVCLDGVKSLAPTGDTIGFLARSLSDIELIGGVLGLFTNSPSTPINLKSCKFAFIKTDQFAPKATNDLKNIWAQAKSLLSSAGAEVVDLDLGPRYEGWMGEHGRYTRMCRAEGGISMQRELVTGRELMGADLPAWVENDILAKEVLRSRDDLGALRPDFDAIAARYDAIITPTLADTAPGKESGGDPYFGSLWTGLHAPSIHVPGFAGENGLPIGLTLVSSR